MNLFYLDENPKRAASYMCNTHIVKMPTETAQMLNTALVLQGIPSPMRQTHANHPVAKWIRSSRENFEFGISICRAMINEYDRRYGIERGEPHGATLSMLVAEEAINKLKFTSKGFSIPPVCMPEEYIIMDKKGRPNTVASYRNFYAKGKSHLLKYKNCKPPIWLSDLPFVFYPEKNGYRLSWHSRW